MPMRLQRFDAMYQSTAIMFINRFFHMGGEVSHGGVIFQDDGGTNRRAVWLRNFPRRQQSPHRLVSAPLAHRCVRSHGRTAE